MKAVDVFAFQLIQDDNDSLAQARIRLDEMWERQSQPGIFNRELMLAFVRAEIEFRKADSQIPQEWLKAEQALEHITAATLVLSRHGLVANIQEGTIIALKNHKQLFKAAEILQDNHMTKEKFFAAIWGSQKFSPSLHDTLIRRLLYRMRRDMKVQVKTEKQLLKLQNVICLS